MRAGALIFIFMCGCARPNYEAAAENGECAFIKKNDLCPLTMSGLNSCAELRFEKSPELGGEDSAILHFSEPLADNVHFEGRLVMPAHGHSSAPPIFERIDQKTFKVSRLRFFMRGEWELHFEVLNDHQTVDQNRVAICL